MPSSLTTLPSPGNIQISQLCPQEQQLWLLWLAITVWLAAVLTAVAAAAGSEGSNTGLGIDYKVRRAEDCLAPGDVIFV